MALNYYKTKVKKQTYGRGSDNAEYSLQDVCKNCVVCRLQLDRATFLHVPFSNNVLQVTDIMKKMFMKNYEKR